MYHEVAYVRINELHSPFLFLFGSRRVDIEVLIMFGAETTFRHAQLSCPHRMEDLVDTRSAAIPSLRWLFAFLYW